MAEIYKRLGSTSLASTAVSKILYQTTSGKSAIISNISVTNLDSNAGSIVISFVKSAITPAQVAAQGYVQPDNERVYQLQIEAGETAILDPGIVLNESNTLVVSGGSNISVSLFGAEIDEADRYMLFDNSLVAGNSYFVVPQGKQHLYRSIILHNTSISTEVAALYVATESGQYLVDDIILNQNLLPNETIAIKLGIGLVGPKSLFCVANPTVNVYAFGVELDVY